MKSRAVELVLYSRSRFRLVRVGQRSCSTDVVHLLPFNGTTSDLSLNGSVEPPGFREEGERVAPAIALADAPVERVRTNTTTNERTRTMNDGEWGFVNCFCLGTGQMCALVRCCAFNRARPYSQFTHSRFRVKESLDELRSPLFPSDGSYRGRTENEHEHEHD
jgi:hypothetical protein